MGPIPYEARLVMAIEAIKNSKKLSVRAAAKIYNVPRSTIQTRLYGVLARRDIPPNSRKLTELEEQAIIRYILDLAHEVALLHTEVARLTKANDQISKRRKAKKTRVRLGGSLTVQDVEVLGVILLFW
jgi:hypothetical protein